MIQPAISCGASIAWTGSDVSVAGVTNIVRPNFVAHGMVALARHAYEATAEARVVVWCADNTADAPDSIWTAVGQHNCQLLHIRKDHDLPQLMTQISNVIDTAVPELADWPFDVLPTPPSTAWLRTLRDRLPDTYWSTRGNFLRTQIMTETPILPRGPDILRALTFFPPCVTRVVIVGQDPYPTPDVADGLCFSTRNGLNLGIPGSLATIVDELRRDPDVTKPLRVEELHGSLDAWAEQGVLLINSVLTVRAGTPASHECIAGWERLVDACIATVSEQSTFCVFLLWGNVARARAKLVSSEKHLVLQAGHPSPRNEGKGFATCGHFGLCNRALHSHGFAPIRW